MFMPVAMVALVVIAPLLFAVHIYNSLVRLGNHCDESWSNVDTELKRRYNLIPNLVQTVKGYAEHERVALEEITRRRSVCMAGEDTPRSQGAKETDLTRALAPLLARVESYPDLKADQHFAMLQEELVDTEDRIQAARRFYNGNVRETNNKVEMFPSSLVARAFGIGEREFFELDNALEAAGPRVRL